MKEKTGSRELDVISRLGSGSVISASRTGQLPYLGARSETFPQEGGVDDSWRVIKSTV